MYTYVVHHRSTASATSCYLLWCSFAIAKSKIDDEIASCLPGCPGPIARVSLQLVVATIELALSPPSPPIPPTIHTSAHLRPQFPSFVLPGRHFPSPATLPPCAVGS